MKKAKRVKKTASPFGLFDFPATLLPISFTGEGGFNPHFFTRLQIERMALDLFNDVFLLHLALEATEGIFQRLPFLQSYFSQLDTPPNRS
jgi:hypothetical protein